MRREVVPARGTAEVARCRRKFLRYFRRGFQDPTYLEWERDYKVAVHDRWQEVLGKSRLELLITEERFREAALLAVQVEQRSRHPMLFSFEKMALRDAVRTPAGAERFARGLYAFLHGTGSPRTQFETWCDAVASLPRKQTRVLTWPMITVFGFLAQPQTHIFLKPNTTRRAAEAYGFDFDYRSKPNWETYASLLEFAGQIRADLSASGKHLRPSDMIDIQSFMWVQGSDEYE